jgi:hypothetical protein
MCCIAREKREISLNHLKLPREEEHANKSVFLLDLLASFLDLIWEFGANESTKFYL